MKKAFNLQNGYIALVSAIILSAILLAVTLSLGFNGFLGRLNILDSESKEQSQAMAYACIQAAILKSAQEIYPVNEIITVREPYGDLSYNCIIISSRRDLPAQGQTLIQSQAVVNKSYTNLKVAIDSRTFDIISYKECALADYCI